MKRLFLRGSCLLLLLISPVAWGAFPFDLTKLGSSPESAPSHAKKAPEEAEILKRRDAALAEQQQAQQSLDTLGAGGDPAEVQYLRSRVQALERLAVTYSELLETFNSLKKVEARIQGLGPILEEWKSGTPPKSFVADFATLDKLRGQAVEYQKGLKSRDQIWKSRQKALEDAKVFFEEAEGQRRQAKEEAEVATGTEEKTAKDLLYSLAQVNSRVAEAQLQLREMELTVSKRYRELSDKNRELWSLQTAYLEKRVVFDEATLQRELASIQEEQDKLQENLVKTQQALSLASKESVKARQSLDQTPQPSPALIEEVEARRLEQNLLEQQVEFVTDRIKQLKERQGLWKERFELLAKKAQRGQVEAWEAQTRQALEQLGRDEELTSLRLNSVRNSLVEIQEKLAAKADADPATRGWILRQQELIQRNIELLQDYQAALLVSKKFDEKFLFEQQQQVSKVSWSERLGLVWDKFLRVWNFEVSSVDDSPITVGKILVALILVLFGTLLARRISRMLGEKVLPRFGVASGVAAALRTLTFYILFLFFFIFALNVVRVPLTIFAVLGGAVAIGIGFGSQNLMNNFISGLILLIERPIKVGDIIQMEQATGQVEHIGGRSTQIRTPDNTQYIIPNSSFLEKPVVNWTLSDDLVRCSVRLGVAYGSSTRKVADLLKQAADNHGKVLKTPQPVANFSDFGPDALVFDLFYWVRMRSMSERREVESDLRFMIDNLFREAEVTIAYPQRDVHLHTSDPLKVRISEEDEKNN